VRHEPQLRPFAALSVGWTGYRDALPRSIRETSGSRRSPARVPAGSAERLRSLSLPKTFAAHGIGVGGFSDCAAGLASRRSRQAWNCHLRARTDSTAQHCTALHSTGCTALDHSTGQSSTAQHWTVKICREDCQHWTTASTGQSRSAEKTAWPISGSSSRVEPAPPKFPVSPPSSLRGFRRPSDHTLAANGGFRTVKRVRDPPYNPTYTGSQGSLGSPKPESARALAAPIRNAQMIGAMHDVEVTVAGGAAGGDEWVAVGAIDHGKG